MALTKLAKYRFNKESNFPGDKKRRIWEIAINNVQNTQIVQILREKQDENLLFKGNLSVEF